MKKEIRKIKKYKTEVKQVLSGETEVAVYITADGKEFDYEKDALKYEISKIPFEKFNEYFINKYKVEEIQIDGLYSAFFITELDERTKIEISRFYHTYILQYVKIGLNFINISYSSDYVSYYAADFNELITEFKTRIQQLEQLIQKYK